MNVKQSRLVAYGAAVLPSRNVEGSGSVSACGGSDRYLEHTVGPQTMLAALNWTGEGM